MKKLAIIIVALVTAGEAQAADFAGLKLGMPATEAWRLLSEGGLGTPKRAPVSGHGNLPGSELYWVGNYNATICRGRVVGLNHTLESTFRAWTREVRVASAERGPGKYTTASVEGVDHVSSVKVAWTLPNGDIYDIGYFELKDQPITAEGTSRSCA